MELDEDNICLYQYLLFNFLINSLLFFNIFLFRNNSKAVNVTNKLTYQNLGLTI